MNTKPQGYTLVELIVVIIILGVLAVSLVPRFFSAAGTNEYLLREQAIAVLRRVQQQAMQCTADSTVCPPPQLLLAADRLGVTAACLNDASHLCTGNSQVLLQPVPATLNLLTFDALGRPQQCTGATGCQLQLQGQVRLTLCIEQQGFIHPC